MLFIEVLKRKDASSVVVSIVLGLALVEFFSIITADLSSTLSGIDGSTGSWQTLYLQPVISLVLKVVALELAIRVWNYVVTFVKK